jgi:NADPH2:quinone reductase
MIRRMRAVWYERKGPAREVLEVGEMPEPHAAPGEVRVRVRASAVNPSDTKGRGGWRGNVAMPFPRIVPHQDGAGVVDETGDGVPPERVGERVWLYEAQWRRPFGTAAEYVVVPAEKAVPLPDATSFEEGACLGIPAMTAHRCVFADGGVAGKTVLVAGGAGAVGYYAVQFARRGGASVIATVSSREQAEMVLAAGADHAIDRKTEDVARRVGEITGAADGRGVDRIVEVAFGANVELDAAILRPNGVIATYSSDSDERPQVPFVQFLMLDATVRFVLVYVMTREAHEAAVADITEALGRGELRHAISRRFRLDETAEAHDAVERGGLSGKAIVTLD